MKKNGFIATSLIYSFFLIFITLFLTIIADYLQNKVLLNTIEKGIKDEINDSMGIRDFEVGEMVGFLDDCNDINDPIKLNAASLYVIANVVLNDSSKCNGVNSCLILYGVNLGSFANNLTYDNIKNDIDTGYQNNTYYNKILYNYDSSSGGNIYSLGTNYSVYKNTTDCTGGEYIVGKNCIKAETMSTPKYRERTLLKELSTGKFEKCGSSSGTIYIKK